MGYCSEQHYEICCQDDMWEDEPSPDEPSTVSPECGTQHETTPVNEPPSTAPTSDDAARQAHEAAEAQRKAEWEAKQQAKREAEQDELDSIAAMSDEKATAASVQRIEADIERLTGRSMKQSVAAFIQQMSRSEPAFARLTLHPRKSMLHCIQYVTRHAQDYLKNELEAEGVKSSGVYGGDVPDDLCYKWAEDYFRDPDAKEDKGLEDKFVPKPYIGARPQAKVQKPEQPPKPTKAELRQKAQEEAGQLTFDMFGKAG